MSADESIRALSRLSMESLLLPVLLQLTAMIVAARLFGRLFRAVGQPSVVGEITAGIALGPSLFGALFPETFALIFRPTLEGVSPELAQAATGKIFGVLAQLGLILLLFQVGLEFDFTHLKVEGRAALAICLVGTLLPFALGAGLAPLIHGSLEDHPISGPVPLFGLTLFLGTAMCITALPILGRMMIEMGIQRTKLAAVVIGAAAVGDAVGWVLLAAVGALARSAYDPLETIAMIAATVLFALVMGFGLRPVAKRLIDRELERHQGQLSLDGLAVVLVVLLLASAATNRIGIFAIFGAFLLGATLSDHARFRQAVAERLRDVTTAFFLPIFFTNTGLRTEIGSLSGTTAWLICLAVFTCAISGKFLGCSIAARLTGFSNRESLIVGIMMNTRALMELIVINVGYELGVIPKSLFCMLVLMAIATTIITAPVVLALRRGTELEAPIAASGFLGKSLRN